MKTLRLKYLVFFLAVGFMFSFTILQEKWDVPPKYESMKNPTKADKENLAIGKQLYDKHCRSCHGKEGLGDGPKAGELETPAGDFTTEAFQKQSDGALFYKTTSGRGDMPEFVKKISSDEDRWLIVNYLRSFAE
jgi:mono/diheme cytochrome c family protein